MLFCLKNINNTSTILAGWVTVLKVKCWNLEKTSALHRYLVFKPDSEMWGDSWTRAAVGPARLQANFRSLSTDSEDVSTSVEQSSVHLSSSSSSLADLILPPPSLYVLVPISLLSAALSRTSLFVLLQTRARKTFLQPSVWRNAFQGHQSHRGVFTVGQIKVLVLRLTLRDVGFTLGWWLWLSRLGLNESMLATHTHCAPGN